MKDKETIEQLFRNEFENFEVQPSKKVWRGVRYDLFIKNFFHFSPRSFNAWYVTGVIIVASVVIFSLSRPGEKVSGDTKIRTFEKTPVSEPGTLNPERGTLNPERGTQNPEPLSTEASAKADGTQNPSFAKTSEAKTRNPEHGTRNPEPGTRNPEHGTRNPEPGTRNPEPAPSTVSEKPSDLSKEGILNYSGQSVFAWFECLTPEGCAPLSANFRNFSQNAVRYSWSFGDGGSSELANPSYIFDDPGTWFVSLTAYSASNEISIFTDSIKVSPMPEARFSMDIQGFPGDGHPVYFYNYSSGANSYLWDFGDGTSSVLKEPNHYFGKKDQANIKLLAISDAGCSDSIILKDAFKTGEPVFIFPTAFAPNTNGPGTGRYTRKDPANDVFYPYVEEDPEEYRLRIFNRTGILIFESNDISIGWDGYYHEELQPQGVYVWKARAVFADGRSVVKMGDVTLLWGN